MPGDWVHPACEAMYRDPQAPTAPLREFLDDFDRDDNVWWMIGSGHHLNLFESALEKICELGQWQSEVLAWIKDTTLIEKDPAVLDDLIARAGVFPS